MRMRLVITLSSIIQLIFSATGFWYGDTRGPLVYDSLDYAEFTVRILRPVDEGPGQHLMWDPVNPTKKIFPGNSINRESFDTQFVLDMEYALGVDRNRIFVNAVTPGKVHFSWESTSVMVDFMFLERNSTNDLTLLEAIAKLTAQIQTPGSLIFNGTNTTNSIDPLFGLQVRGWDVSLRLLYAIEVIGGKSVVDGDYINYGGLGFCDVATDELPDDLIQYCEFERFFEDDVARALNISYYRVQILFVKRASLDSSLIHFRLLPPKLDAAEASLLTTLAHLTIQVLDSDSTLYHGNVTIRVDQQWGISNTEGILRKSSAPFTYRYYDYDPRHLTTDRVIKQRRPPSLVTDYSRCKANRRCNWGIIDLNQTTNDVRYYHQLFERGQLLPINLFLDFEDWRLGTRGFSWDGDIPPTQAGMTSIPKARAKAGTIRGAHFWPFDQTPLGPDIPSFMQERNQGLILDRRLHNRQIGFQEALVYDLEGRVSWIDENLEVARMDAKRRSRKDVKIAMLHERDHFTHWLSNERDELIQLNTSQCTLIKCSILFNTSSLLLTGAINAQGIIGYTGLNTEVAVFSFNSIYLGPDTEVTVVGQRALVLVSKTSAIINTTFSASPGTLGGFPGGGSVARLVNQSLDDHPTIIPICELGNYCLNRSTSSSSGSDSGYRRLSDEERRSLVSNNVNGPGSGNLRIYPFIIHLTTADIDEIQTITTSARPGQTLTGGFIVSFGSYSTPIIPYDASAKLMKEILEDNLNLVRPQDLPRQFKRTDPLRKAGIGLINVTRSAASDELGYTWTITFITAIGNIPQLHVLNYLQGLDTSVKTLTVRDGNEINGTFSLSFQGSSTSSISTKETANELQKKLLQLPNIQTAYVERNDMTENCDDGLCENGPQQGRGFLWTIYVTTNDTHDNITPTSPTSILTKQQGEIYRFLVKDTTDLQGENTTIRLSWGLEESPNQMLSLLNLSIPFSLAWGGAGGSYGGQGGKGYSSNPVGSNYGDEKISDLLGGSGGCMQSKHPFEINALRDEIISPGIGGAGGGAFEIIAANDIVIGTYGKILMKGGDGEQTSEGGGGGGSGGSILLAAGGVVVNQGILDASGGNGGFGGPGEGTLRSQLARANANAAAAASGTSSSSASSSVLAGGGGGGGRVAIFGQSIINSDGIMTVDGGKCGVFKVATQEIVLALNVTFYVSLQGLIDENILVNLVATFINQTIETEFVTISHVTVNGIYDAVLDYEVLVSQESNVTRINSQFQQAQGTNLADVIINQTWITSSRFMTIYPVREHTSSPTGSPIRSEGGVSTSVCENHGSSGSLYTEATMTSLMYIRETNAAEGTQKALFFSNNESTFTSSGTSREAPFAWNGPILPFEPSQPTRVTYYSQMESIPGLSQKANFGSLFTLLSRGVEGLNVSSVIGIFIGDQIKHGANFGSSVDEKYYFKRMTVIDSYPAFDRWYKVDIHINWNTHTYYILLDDVLVVRDAKFVGDDVDGIRLSVTRATNVWFDEIYVGFDPQMNFSCPMTVREGSRSNIPLQKGWSLDEVNEEGSSGFSEYSKMTRHYSHLEPAGLKHFDGQGHVRVFEDIKNKYSDGDYPILSGKLHAGALRYLTNSPRSARSPLGNSATVVSPKGLWNLAKDGIGGAGDGRHFLYIEHDTPLSSTSSSSSSSSSSASASIGSTYSRGGIGACSSQDLSSWRFEGIIFHYENLTDMVYGMDTNFTIDRPTVLYNSLTSQYIMWFTMNDPDRTLGLAGVASSPYADGPYLFRRSLYPDGNKTRDQAAFLTDTTIPLPILSRTYYATQEYIMPEAVMQPTWESVRNRDGTTNFRLNYHRANYTLGYDNFHDIYLQRWRKEDIAYQVECIHRITGEVRQVSQNDPNPEICIDPIEYKRVIGQGNPPVLTKFVSPNSSDNSWWMQTSVPSVRAQPWASSYRDGYCGIRDLDDGIDINDPILEEFIPSSRGSCSNIADNKPHPSLEDKLISIQRVVLKRRSKYVAISELTDDFLDTTGRLKSFEGELSTGNLITMMTDNGQFEFSSGERSQSTFQSPRRSEYETADDYKYRFRQYIYNFNDRAQYALACVIDKVCPVNFAEQLTVGQT
jgi:hypothetical protein